MFPQLVEILDTHYIECRKNRRYTTAEPGRLCGVTVEVRNVSVGGAQVVCGEAAFDDLAERLSSPVVDVEILVAPPLALQARVVYENKRDAEHLIGVQFVDLTAEQKTALEDYIVSLA